MSEHFAFVKVDYSFRDDWHIFTSIDVPGLYVTNKDAKVAFRDLSHSIELLAKLNDGLDCDVRPVPTYNEFVQTLKARDSSDAEEQVLGSGVIRQQQQFLVTERAA